MKINKNMVLVAIAAIALVWFVSHGDGNVPNPFAPQRPDRPILKLIVRAAKTFLWVAMFAEPKPQPAYHVVQTSVGHDGSELLQHGDF